MHTEAMTFNKYSFIFSRKFARGGKLEQVTMFDIEKAALPLGCLLTKTVK